MLEPSKKPQNKHFKEVIMKRTERYQKKQMPQIIKCLKNNRVEHQQT